MISEIIMNKRYSGINPLIVGEESCRPLHTFGPGVRTIWLLHYVKSGCGKFRFGEKEYHLGHGDIFVIPPFTDVFYQADAKNPWHYMWVGFECDGTPPYPFPEKVIHCPETEGIFLDMFRCKTLENGRTEFLCGKLWELFSVFLEREKPEYDYVEMAISCINAEYTNGITVKEIAERLNLDRSYFSTIFSKKTGVPPQKYLNDLRLSKACELLINHGANPSAVAASTGYGDICNFSKMFKRHYGMSPRKYATLHKKII